MHIQAGGPAARRTQARGIRPQAAASSPSSSSLLPRRQPPPPAARLPLRSSAKQPSTRPDRRPAISRPESEGYPDVRSPVTVVHPNRLGRGAAAPTTRRCLKWEERRRGPESRRARIQSRLRLRPAMRPTARTRSWQTHCSGQRRAGAPAQQRRGLGDGIIGMKAGEVLMLINISISSISRKGGAAP